MRLSAFLEKGDRARRLSFPEALNVYHPDCLNSGWNVVSEDGKYIVEVRNTNDTLRLTLQELLQRTLPATTSMMQVHNAVLAYCHHNQYKHELPLFFVRRHGSATSEKGDRRRRGWMVKFNNAYVVYADNFLTRHFFEYVYFASHIDKEDIESLVRAHLLPFSSGGGQYEKKHRLFPSLSHLTSNSQLYISHLYDVNKGPYSIGGRIVSGRDILGDSSYGDFGYGSAHQWDEGIDVDDGKKCRVIQRDLSDAELTFLRASNIRCLSPLNYFPFPKPNIMHSGSISGEDAGLRNAVISLYRQWFGKTFDEFVRIARVPNLFHETHAPSFVSHKDTRSAVVRVGNPEPRAEAKKSEGHYLTTQELVRRIEGWKAKEDSKVHRIVDKVYQAGGRIKKNLLANYMRSDLKIADPDGTLSSMMTNRPKQYGMVLVRDGDAIAFHSEIYAELQRIWRD